jgi:hypothetical protein
LKRVSAYLAEVHNIPSKPMPPRALSTTYWRDIKARLRQTGHREGTPVKGNRRLFISEGDADLPRVRVAYSILGDTLYVDVVYVPPPR